MKDPLSWGIIGTGKIASAFASAIDQTDSGRIVAVASRTKLNAEHFGEMHGIERCLAGYQALLDDEDVEAVYISTPHPMHAEWVIKCAEAGKHILCEKPITLNAADTMAVIEAARRNDVFLMEAFMYRCHPQTNKLVELLQDRIVGDVKLIRATFGFRGTYDLEERHLANSLGGGGILDLGCYTVSMSRLIAAVAQGIEVVEPREIYAVGHVSSESHVDEYTSAILKFDGDILAEVSCGVRLATGSEVRIYGTDGHIVIPEPWFCSGREGGTSYIEIHRTGEPSEYLKIETGRWLYAIEADHVSDNIKNRQASFPGMTWDDSLANMRTLDRWREAIGMDYQAEREDSLILPIHGRPLTKRDDCYMTFGTVTGIDKPVSKIVMGTLNRRDLRYASLIYDDYFELGGNCFDTARQYGQSEPTLGKWMRNRDIRDQIVLLTKGAHTPNCYPENVTIDLERSLDELGTDHADIYLLHRDNPEVPVGEFVDVLNENHAAGRIRVFGGSNWDANRVDAANEYAAKHGFVGFSVISNNFSLARMIEPPWEGCLTASGIQFRKWLEESQMPLFSWSSQAQGFFSGRSGSDRTFVSAWHSEDNFERLKRATTLAENKGTDPTAIALSYLLAQPFPLFPIIGPATMHETISSLQGLLIHLSPDEVEWLDLER